MDTNISPPNVSDESLQASEALMRTALDHLPLIFYMIDHQGIFRLSIGAGLKGLGLEQNQVVGKSAFDIYKDFPEIVNSIHRSLAGETVNFETQVAGSSYFNISVPFANQSGGFTGIVAVALDITERRRTEETLQNMQKLESLGILAGGIAHDFNNLLGGIFGFIDLANGELEKGKASSYLSKAISTIDRMRALTAQLLTFAKGGAPVQKIGCLFPFVQETAQFALSGSNVVCNFDIPQHLWACNFDKNQIGQVIDNIIINAQQAMPVGGTINLIARNVTLEQKEHPSLAKGSYVKISIQDSGIGIPQKLLHRIFDPFYTTKPKGHGLGLSTCYSIINRHGGCINVESEPDKGAVFHIYLPANQASLDLSPEVQETRHKGTGMVLVMDDEEVIRETLSAMLSSFGYCVICKENGEDAVDFFMTEMNNNNKISAMIFDLTVPGGMGGKAAVEKIRKITQEIPVFVASGYAEDPVIKNPLEYGFTASICKPFMSSELAEMFNKHLKS